MLPTLLPGLADALVARLILLANHVIASEPVAVQKLQPHAGRCIRLRIRPPARMPLAGQLLAGWPDSVDLRVTPAGLLEQIPASTPSDLTGLNVTMELPDPLAALRMAVRRERPDVQIDGDAGLAEAVSWMMKHLRWDIEDDLARWLGVPPTQLLKVLADRIKQALSRFAPGAGAWRSGPGR